MSPVLFVFLLAFGAGIGGGLIGAAIVIAWLVLRDQRQAKKRVAHRVKSEKEALAAAFLRQP